MTSSMTRSDNLRKGGRPRGLGPRLTRGGSGAYLKKTTPADILSYWRRKSPGNAMRAEKHINECLRYLNWTAAHPRYPEILALAVKTVSRGLLFSQIIDKDFKRAVKDPETGRCISERSCDQFYQLWKLDSEIDRLIKKLKLLPKKPRHTVKRKLEGDKHERNKNKEN